MYNIEYINNLESLLYKANKRVEELTTPYNVEINGKKETIQSLKELQKMIKEVEQPIEIKIKKKRLKK